MKRMVFPFSAVLGQEAIKNALIWNFINPLIGGVLISGQKGTAKSTLVRASACLSGKKLVELPLNITEDRLIGAIDFEAAIQSGVKRLDRGILAGADQNILYVDEINLLSDSVTKTLLEAASAGYCRVEREGISDRYPCEFILVGSMNPEESGLRPQLLDRFGLVVDVAGESSREQRAEVVRRRLEFEEDPALFAARFQDAQQDLAQKIAAAQQRLRHVTFDNQALMTAATLSIALGVDGHRADITMIKTAMTLCAFEGRTEVNREDLKRAAVLVLPHRMRRNPFDSSVLDETAIDRILDQEAHG